MVVDSAQIIDSGLYLRVWGLVYCWEMTIDVPCLQFYRSRHAAHRLPLEYQILFTFVKKH
jgi:hypothetical protein